MDATAGQSSTVNRTSPTGDAEWRLPDLIDFEYLLEQDRETPLEQLDSRDRRIHEEQLAPGNDSSGKITADRRKLFRGWLEARRQPIPSDQPLPGEVARMTWSVFTKIILLAGLLLGSAAAAEMLQYDGQQPVNVAAFLGWLVLFQIALVILSAAVVVLRKTGLLSTEATLVSAGLRWLWHQLSIRLNRHLWNRVSGEHRQRLQSFMGIVAGRQSLYGRVALWPVVGSMQLFGVCFNIGALLTTLGLVIFSDRAFGWQSAVNFQPEQIHQITRALAVPWSAFLADAASPTLQQIAGSKIVLKEGIKQLATENLVAWWPFLCMSLAVYGLLPRLALWGATLFLGRSAIRRIDFQHAACDRLYERMTTGRLETAGSGTEAERRPIPDDPATTIAVGAAPAGKTLSTDSAIALVSPDLVEQIDAREFSKLLSHRFHLELERLLPWPDETQARHKALETLASVQWEDKRPRLVLLEEAWQPPIAEKLSGLRQLRTVLGDSAKLIVCLVGRPNQGGLLTAVSAQDWKVWERQMATLGDTQLRLEPLVRND